MANHTPGSKPIDIYFYQASPPSRAVLMLIKGLDLNHNVVITNIMEQDNLKPEFLKVLYLIVSMTSFDNFFFTVESTTHHSGDQRQRFRTIRQVILF